MHGMAELFSLQAVDLHIAQLDVALRAPEQRRQIQRLKRLIEVCHNELKQREEERRASRSSLGALEADLARVEAAIKECEQKLFGGEARPLRELADLQEQLESSKRRRDHLEERVLEGLEALEQAETAVATARRKLKRAQRSLSQVESILKEFLADGEARRTRLLEERAQLRAVIPPKLLSTYDSLDRLGTKRVVTVEAGSCSGCHMALPTSAGPAVTSTCPHCGRLLWWHP